MESLPSVTLTNTQGCQICFVGKHLFSQIASIANPSSVNPSDHLYPLVSFFSSLQSHGWHLDYAYLSESCFSVNGSLEPKRRLLVLFDAPLRASHSVRSLLQLYERSLLVLCEHPNYQHRDLAYLATRVDHIISRYHLSDVSTPVTYTHIDHLFNALPILSAPQTTQQQSAHIVLVNSNLYSFRSSNYPLRRGLINALTMIMPESFQWYGRGWQRKDTPSAILDLSYHKRNAILTLLRYPAIKSYSCYGGELGAKTELIGSKSIVAIENYSYPSGYHTEKLFEPLTLGLVPLYLGSSMSPLIEELRIEPATSLSEILALAYSYQNISHSESLFISRQYSTRLNDAISQGRLVSTLDYLHSLIMNDYS